MSQINIRYEKPHIKPRSPRHLQCKLSHSVKSYNLNLQKYIRIHNPDARAQALKETARQPLTDQQQKEYEEIDKLTVEGMKQSEAKCRKLKMGGVQWTPQVSTNFETINVIRMLIKKKSGGKVRTALIRRTLEKTNLDGSTLTKPVHELQIMEADIHMNRIYYKKNHVTHRKKWLSGQQSQMYDRGKRNIASKLKDKQNREEMRRISSRINIVLRPFKSRGVTKIMSNGEEITTHEGIVEGFRKEAIKRGKKTENTPFMQQPLVGTFGFKASNEDAEAVLDGTFIS